MELHKLAANERQNHMHFMLLLNPKLIMHNSAQYQSASLYMQTFAAGTPSDGISAPNVRIGLPQFIKQNFFAQRTGEYKYKPVSVQIC